MTKLPFLWASRPILHAFALRLLRVVHLSAQSVSDELGAVLSVTAAPLPPISDPEGISRHPEAADHGTKAVNRPRYQRNQGSKGRLGSN